MLSTENKDTLLLSFSMEINNSVFPKRNAPIFILSLIYVRIGSSISEVCFINLINCSLFNGGPLNLNEVYCSPSFVIYRQISSLFAYKALTQSIIKW